MFTVIETETDEKIKKKLRLLLTKLKEHLFESSKYPRIKLTGVSELRELIGLLYFRVASME